MPKNLDISLLLDFYGDMLTPKQREAAELYHNEDLSLAEIAQHLKITRQGVRDSIKRAEFQLIDYEEKLGLYTRFVEIKEGLDEISELAQGLSEFLSRIKVSREATAGAKRILQIADRLNSD